jgi:RNA polymerase sigma factor (TIGR02999 family)
MMDELVNCGAHEDGSLREQLLMDTGTTSRDRVTTLLSASSHGQVDASKLIPLVYDELRGLARKYFRHERPDHTLQPTALVHEAYMRLVDEQKIDWHGRAHFRAVCAKVMRRVLVDYARARRRVRRGGGVEPLTLEAAAPLSLETVDAVELHEALERLAEMDERQAKIVELRFYGGMSVEEIAHLLGVSKRTVEGNWTHAKAWLRNELKSD